MMPAGETPRVKAGFAYLAAHQPVAERQRGLLAVLFVTGADRRALVVIHQRQINRPWHRALRKLHRRANVNQRDAALN